MLVKSRLGQKQGRLLVSPISAATEGKRRIAAKHDQNIAESVTSLISCSFSANTNFDAATARPVHAFFRSSTLTSLRREIL